MLGRFLQAKDSFKVCCKAYNVIREHAHEFVNLFSLMLSTGIPELQKAEDIEWLRKVRVAGLAATAAEAAAATAATPALVAEQTGYELPVALESSLRIDVSPAMDVLLNLGFSM